MNKDIATLAGGCFWCTEAIFRRLTGVISVTPGYSGGKDPNPTYSQVCSGKTGHAESIQIEYDPNLISYVKILDVFWHTHDPTTLNQQGADKGTQYRSAIFYHNEMQKAAAEQSKAQLALSGEFDDPIVTEITPFTHFYTAEEHHKNYFDKNSEAPYCKFVIAPKLKAFSEKYTS